MNDPVTNQYQCFNQRRLHYSWLFWASIALYLMGTGLCFLIMGTYIAFNSDILKMLAGGGVFLSLIIWRIHGQELYYERLMRNIEDHWAHSGITGVQQARLSGNMSSRKLVILTVLLASLGLFALPLLVRSS